jgi:hypothetical protein
MYVRGFVYLYVHRRRRHTPRRIEGRPSARPRRVVRDGRNGAYRRQRRDGRGVPRADVCVECLREVERLRADRQRSTGNVKNSCLHE